MSAVVIVQARLGSRRFPRKVLADLNGKPVLDHVMERVRQIPLVKVVLAVPHEDRELARFAYNHGAFIYFGSEHDVLARYAGAASYHNASTIIRITADCPLLDPLLCRRTIELFDRGECNYAAIGWPRTFPKGYGCEVFSRFTLDLANNLAKIPQDREHVTPWMERNVICKYLTQDKDESHLNYCVDEPADIERLSKILLENKQ